MARRKHYPEDMEDIDTLESNSEIVLEPVQPKSFRILNKSSQIVYVNLPTGTLALRAGTSADVPASAVESNHHLKVMVNRGHVALFEH